MGISSASKAGVAIFLGGVQFSLAIILAEVYYPGYSVSTNTLSDLGANCSSSGSCVISQPSSMIINTSVIILGLLVIAGAYFLQKAFAWAPATALITLAGIGAIGVGVFPETAGILHGIFSLIVFLFAGLTAIVTARFQRKPMFYFSIVLGVATLVALFLYVGSEYLGLGPGGMERMIVYPALLWAIGFGGHMMATEA